MSGKVVLIDPVTRIEGEVKVHVVLDEKGLVKEVFYQAVEFRGFEAFCRGRPIEDLPRVTSAICGVCSWAHHLASAKAVDNVFGREPPVTATKVRELSYLAHIVDSHLLHFTLLALPDFVPSDLPPKLRNVVGLYRKYPELVKLFLRSRQIVKEIEEVFGGKSVHPTFAIPGGVSKKVTKEDVERLSKLSKELYGVVSKVYEFFKSTVLKSKTFQDLLNEEAYNVKTYYMGLVDGEDNLNFYDGFVKIIDFNGREVAKFNPKDYVNHIAEHVEDWTYTKFPYLRSVGWKGFKEEYIVRVGPLARLNITKTIPTPMANEAFKELVDVIGSRPIHNSLAYHWCRLVECIYACERISQLLQDKDILGESTVNMVGKPSYEGVGIVEAPRGTLIHHYKSDENFITKEVNIITPTAINNASINTELKKVASKLIKGCSVDERLFNLIEVGIRSYDPCTACATHVINLSYRPSVEVLIYDEEGQLVKRVCKVGGR